MVPQKPLTDIDMSDIGLSRSNLLGGYKCPFSTQNSIQENICTLKEKIIAYGIEGL
jgi:hypothetical protein